MLIRSARFVSFCWSGVSSLRDGQLVLDARLLGVGVGLLVLLVLAGQAAGDLAEHGLVADVGDDHLADAVHDLRAAVQAARLVGAVGGVVGRAAACLRTGSDSPVISDWSIVQLGRP